MTSQAKFISVIVVFGLSSIASARITSSGRQTADAIRSKLTGNDFKIDPFRGHTVRTPNAVLRLADLSKFPALAGKDVQAQVVRGMVRPYRTLFRQYHPRGTEIFTTLRGNFEVKIWLEGPKPRIITLRLYQGQSTVFPQGLTHTVRCGSKHNCHFHAVFTSADPGLVGI